MRVRITKNAFILLLVYGFIALLAAAYWIGYGHGFSRGYASATADSNRSIKVLQDENREANEGWFKCVYSQREDQATKADADRAAEKSH
jgi:hypothetical protein